MAAPRKNPPANIREIIEQYVAGEGGSTVILGRAIGVSDSTVRKWFAEDESLMQAYEGAREAYMHKLYLELIQMARSGKGNVAGLIFTLKAKFKQYDMPGSGKLVDVNVTQVNPVLVVKDHGTDEQWQAKALAQQRVLTIDAAQVAPVPALPIGESLSLAASVVPACYGPPIYPWQSQAAPVPNDALEAIPNAPVAPLAPLHEAPAWRGNA